MSRVHCLECGTSVVLDPRGVCPEGHHVGAQGARVEQAMGHELAHPDEPEPWVYRIEPGELPVGVGASASTSANGAGTCGPGGNGSGPRQARPVRLTSVEPEDTSNDAESLLRELHSLAAFEEQSGNGRANGHRPVNGTHPQPGGGGGASTPGPVGPPAATTPPVPPAATTTSRPRPPRPDPDAMAEAFAELSALDAPGDTTTGRSRGSAGRSQDPATRGGHGTGRADEPLDHDQLASLFSEPSPPADPVPPPPTHDTALPPEDHAGTDHEPSTDPPAAPTQERGAAAPPAPDGPAPLGDGAAPRQVAAGDRPSHPRDTPPPVPDGHVLRDAAGHHPSDQVHRASPAQGPAPTFEVDATELSMELDLGDGAGVDLGDGAGVDAGVGHQDDDVAAQLSALSSTDALFSAPTEVEDTQPAAGATPGGGLDDDAGPRSGSPHSRPPAPDMTSFTAKGGAASRTGRRRRFGR